MRKTEFIKNLENSPKSPLGEGFVACNTDMEIINIGTAETHLLNDFLVPVFQNRPEFTSYNLTYAGGFRQMKLAEAFAKLFVDHFGIKEAKGDEIIFGSGIAQLVEKAGLVLCEPGDVVLIPKPCYGCFEPDLQMCRCKVEYIDLDHLPEKPPANAKLLLLTNPGNPVGELVPEQEKLLEWAYQVPELHVITDEVYALSGRNGKPFTSICANPKADLQRVHLFYGISKDWGMAGLHFGIFWSKNKEFVRQMNLAKGCYSLGSDTVQILERIFGDIELRDRMIVEGRKRLIESYKIITSMLKEAGIPYRECDYSLFLMADLTKLAKTAEEELDVWRTLFKRFKVHILPGFSGFQYPTPGWYRVCFAMEEEKLREGLSRLIKGYNTLLAEKK